jgi:hypothetical protein
MNGTKDISSLLALQLWEGLCFLQNHYRDFKTGSNKSNFIDISWTTSSLSTVEDTGVLHIIKKGEHMNSLEKFHFYI